MEHIYVLDSNKDKLNYIKKFSLAVFEELKLEPEINKIAVLKNEYILRNAVVKAFEISGEDAIITSNIYKVPTIGLYLTKKLTVRIDGKYKIIGRYCFSHSPSVENVILDEGLEYIEEGAFRNNTNIRSITFPKSLKSLDCLAFGGCKNLSKVTFLNSETSVCYTSFEDTKWFDSFSGDFVIINGMLYKYNGNSENVIIPEGTVHIDFEAFAYNNTIKKIICPSTLKYISVNAFADCTNLQTVVFNDDLETVYICAFKGCKSLKEVVLPEKLMFLGGGAFDRSTKIICYKNNKKIIEEVKKYYPEYNIIE